MACQNSTTATGNASKTESKHLTFDERLIIQRQLRLPKKDRLSMTQLAQTLGKNRSTIWRGIKRGSVEQRTDCYEMNLRYHAEVGQRRYGRHRENCRWEGKISTASEFISIADEQIHKEKRSPAQACAIACAQTSAGTPPVCGKTIYNYISAHKIKADSFDLHLKLRRKAAKKGTAPVRTGKIPEDAMSIDQRPDVINERREIGRLEIDSVLGKRAKGAAILTLDDRAARKRHAAKTGGKNTDAVREGLSRILRKMPEKERAQIKSITSDNGPEFKKLADGFPEYTIYYAHPYRSGEGGTNERQNGIMRWFIPKGTPIEDVSEEKLQRVIGWINTMPRKMFGWKDSNTMMAVLSNTI